MTVKKKSEQEEGLADWRKNNWKRVLNKVGLVLEAIMDDPASTPRDKNEAARTLARMANILTPEKVEESTKKAKEKAPWWEEELSEDDQRELDTILHPPKA